MKLGTFYGALELHREDRILYGRFTAPHRVVSTCQVAGGLREDLEVIYNRQVCEPAGHCERHGHRLGQDPLLTRREVCEMHGLPEAAATLGTAANMRCAGLAQRRFRDLEVVVACTAGVEGNAGRAGDPAGNFEWEGRFERLAPHARPEHGTINTLLFISHELTPGALVRTLMTATEAKSAALQDLAVGSRYSVGRATGTGTDQIASACRLGTGIPLTSAGKHGVLGQLIGEAVAEAIRSALVLQNGLTPESRRSVLAQLQRFGLTEERLLDGAKALLPGYEAELLARNLLPIVHDPVVVAAAASMAEVADQVRTSILPRSCVPELTGALGAQLACAVSGDYGDFAAWRQRMESPELDPAMLAVTAISLGFGAKWRRLHGEETLSA
jgi:adenosylcobinamide amidohydrolase